MERLKYDRRYRLNDKIENWEAIANKALGEMNGTLFLIDEKSGEEVEAQIIFLYSTLIYSGYNSRGIVKIGKDIGSVFVNSKGNLFLHIDNGLSDMSFYNEKIQEIVEDLDEDCRYSEAIHARGLRDLNDTESMQILINQYHAMQRRNKNPNIPYTEHLKGVATLLDTVAKSQKEIPDGVRKDMILAALGHDLLEDTAIDEDRIKEATNNRVLQLIKELTNPNDDAHLEDYMTKLVSDSEEARLIKYADLIENTSSFCYSLHEPNIDNPVQRAKDYYIPILARTTEVLAKTSFEKYPKTTEAMRLTLKVYTDLLLSRVKLLEEKG